MSKLLYFTKEISPNAVDKSATLGIIGETDPSTYPQDGIKRVPALTLVKAMKQMTDKGDYEVTGDPQYIEAGKKLGFQAKEIIPPPPPDEWTVKYNELQTAHKQTLEHTKQVQDKFLAQEKELQRIKKEMKDILLK